ncbi:MAG: hypothetical protein NTV11_03925 [Rhodocyclales bacterium]|nr:hypothetical protein [Rhodocyclales bacterium]
MNTKDSSTISLSEVHAGARLTAAVLGADGQVLMTAGSILTEAALEKLAQRGIVAVTIEQQRDEAELTEASEALHRRLDDLFRRCDLEGDSGAQTLFEAVLAYRLEALQ